MKSLSSRDNPLFKELKKLGSSSKFRRESGKTLLDGWHLIQACIDSGHAPDLMVLTARAYENAHLPEGIPITILSDSLFNELSPVQTPVGVLARFSIPAASRQEQPAFYAILEDIQDPGNMGTILRSAAAAGVDTAYLSPACTDAWSPKVLRSGMGAHFLLNIVEQCDLPAVLPSLPGKCIATQPDAEELLYSVDMTGNIGIAIGNEGSGLSAEILKACHHKVSIPMPGNMESLNAAAAATICFFERVRQLNHATPL